MSDGPAAVIVNEAGTNVAEVKGASTAAVAGDKALVVAVSPNNTVAVSAASLPLPSGAATSANQTNGNQQTQIVQGGNTATVTGANALKVDGSAVTQPVSAASLPLPTGAATSANQTTLGSQTTKINDGTNTATVTGANALKVDGSAVTQPVSATSLPLPTGAATEATLAAQTLADNTAFTDGTTQVTPAGYILDETSGPALTEDDVGAARIDTKRAQVHVIEDATTRGQRMVVTAAGAAKVDGSTVTQPVSAASLPLPAGAATSANQTTLGSQTTKINDGTNTAAVTASSALKVDGSAVTQPVSGTVTANVGSTGGLALDATVSAQSLADNTAFTDGTTQVTPAGFILDETSGPALAENDAGAARIDTKRAQVIAVEDATTRGQRMTVTAAGAAKVDGSAVTQPVSAASLPLPTGAATSANQTTLGSQTTKINDGTNTATVTGSNALKVDGSAVTQPVSGTVTANIGTSGALALDATLSAQSLVDNAAFTDGSSRVVPSGYILDETAGTALSENDVGAARIDSKRSVVNVIEDATTRGQRLTITASNAAKVDGSAVTQPISAASLPLPSGAATEATLATRLADATFTGRINTLGQKTMANSTPVVLASDQTVIPVSDNAGSLTVDTPQLPAALVGGRLDENVGAWLGSTAPTVGQKTMANSVPVVISSDQSEVQVKQGTAAAASGAWPSKVTDGTNTAAVKAASTAAVAGDPSLVVALSPNSPTPLLTDRQASGSITALNGAVSISAAGLGEVGVQITGTWVQTLSFEATIDGTNFFSVTAFPIGTGGAGVSSTAANGQWRIGVSGYLTVRVRSSAFTSGTAVVTVEGSQTASMVRAAQGAPNTLANNWPVQHTDGTNVQPTMDAVGRAGYVRITDGTNTLGTLFNTFHADPNGDRRTIHNNATITASGSTVVTWNGWSEWYLIINLKNAPTGTAPTIQFKVEQVDPIDQTTILTTAAPDVKSATGVVHTAAGIESLEIPELISDAVKISWTVTGTTPSWTGVNVSWCGHGAGNAIEGQAEDGQLLHDGPVPVAGVDKDSIVHTFKVGADGSLIVSPTGSDQTPGLAAGTVVLGGGTSGTFNIVRATTYNEQTSNAQRSMSSSSASDTSAGTGARQVQITYFTATMTGPFTENITLNGTSAVNTVATNICFIEKMEVVSVGSGGANVGTITLFISTAGGGGTLGTIGVGTLVSAVGDNRTLWAHHYIATGITSHVTSMVVSASAATNFILRQRNPTVSTSPYLANGGVIATTAAFQRNFGSPVEILGPAVVTAWGIPSTNNVTLFSSFDFYEG